MSGQPGREISPRTERFLRSVLPVGIILLAVWIVWLIVEIAFGDSDRGFSVATAIIGLATSIVLIVSGLAYRRVLDRR